jgi:hypothetical protein
MLHLLNRVDANDQDVAKFLDHYSRFLDSYNKTIASLCRRLEALELVAGLRHPVEGDATQFDSVADAAQRITDHAVQAGLTVQDWAKAFNAAPPAPEAPAEALAARPLLERVARLGDVIGRQTVAQVQQLANQAAAWLRENPSGQTVAIEPRGCPTPGACSCVEPTSPAPVPGEVARPTFQDAIRLAQGCHDYSGGHSGAEGKAWHGAIDTVVSALKRAAVGPWDSQTRAVYGVGVEAQAGEVAVPVAELDDQRREAVHQAVAEALGSGAYDCTRVWSAWGYGTMGPDDFVPVAKDDDRVAEIADAAIEAIRAIPAPQAGEVEA